MRLPVAIAALLLSISVEPGSTQTRMVALTIDDLPFVSGADGAATDAAEAISANRKLLHALGRRHIPVTGFVIQKNVEGLADDSGTGILRDWIAQGFDLGNHTYAHPDFDHLTVEEFEHQILRGEDTFLPLMTEAGRTSKFFRFPANHTGDTKEKHDAVAAFLAERGYRLAPCTIEDSDWLFNAAYARMRARHDRAAEASLRAAYLAYAAAEIDFLSGLDKQVLGYAPPEIMLIHDNRLNADVIDKLLTLFEERQYRWITLTQAESDPVYQVPDTFITSFGPMWGYRWAKERGVKVDGSLEPDPPQWITGYGEQVPGLATR
jgi:peptidoglycan/xylan/chitin deacetylase (PgdA/CDA1 family)